MNRFIKVPSRAVIRNTRVGKYLLIGHSAFQINEVVEHIISLCNGTRTREEMIETLFQKFQGDRQKIEADLDKFIQKMTDSGALKWTDDPAPVEPIYIPDKPASLIIEITHTCNQNCDFCIANAGSPLKDELSFEELDSLTNEIIDLRINPVNITGGEPLTRKDVVLHMANRISSHGLTPKLLTNACLVNGKLAHDLYQAGIRHAQVSIDGFPEVHDRVRGMKNAFDKAKKGISFLREVGIEVTTATTLLREQFEEMENLHRLVGTLGDKNKISPIRPQGRGQNSDHSLTPVQYFKYLTYISKRSNGELSTKIIPRERCSIGTTPLIQPNGDIFPCMLTRFDELKLGNIRKSTLSDIWKNSEKLKELFSWTVEDIEGCRDCWNRLFCGAGCRGMAYSYHGTLYKNDPYVCGANKLFAKELLKSGTSVTKRDLKKVIEIFKPDLFTSTDKTLEVDAETE